jgi:CRISPR/Cas system CSM-associated protein Csm3 (group 7 of RAMP superfamily)
MAKSRWSGELSRRIAQRIIVEGDLVLQTPAHFGSGDASDQTDLPLLVDSYDNKSPLLTGTSIAGALRSYLQQHEYGYLAGANPKAHSIVLFGGLQGDEEGEQSPLIIEDVLGKNFGIETRDGVKIEATSRTAEEDKLFEFQLWRAGTTFRLRFELLLSDNEEINKKRKLALVTALQGFTDGSITLGGRKRRGYGQVKVEQWYHKTFDLKDKNGLIDWIKNGAKELNTNPVSLPALSSALGVNGTIPDVREYFQIKANFKLPGSLLIRSGGGKDDVGPHDIHLRSYRIEDKKEMPILSGTSLAGALRNRALKIANSIGDSERARKLVNEMFGPEMDDNNKTPRASRIFVTESKLENAQTDLVQNRVSIDRFTGGARETALFSEQPAWGNEKSRLEINTRLVNPKSQEIGLLLLLLKDLWTGDLPLGGESSVGRGRLEGLDATLTHHLPDATKSKEWTIKQSGEKLKTEFRINGEPQSGDGRDELEAFVAALRNHLREGQK